MVMQPLAGEPAPRAVSLSCLSSHSLSLTLLSLSPQAGVEQVPLAGLQIIRGDNM